MSPLDIVLLMLLAAVSCFVQRVTGFGFGIICMTALPYLMPSYGEATALSGLMAAVASLIPAVKTFRFIPWKKLIPILLTFLVVSFFAVGIVTKVDSASLKHYLGAALILVSVYFFFFSKKIHLRPSLPTQIGMGTLSGLMGGLFSMQGPPAVIYFISASNGKREYLALTQWYFLTGNIMMSVFRAQKGFLTPCVGEGFLFALPAIAIGLWFGAEVYRKVKGELLRKIIYCFLAVAGVFALVL